MHARLDELLSLRDGEPVDAALGPHLQTCEFCAAELRRLSRLHAELRERAAKPTAGPGWPAVRDELLRRERRRALRRRQARYVAAASLGAVALMFGLRVGDGLRHPASGAAVVQLPPAIEGGSGPTLEEMRRRSQELEAQLGSLPQRPAVERADVGVPISLLEERVQWRDHELTVAAVGDATASSSQEALWRDRVEALDTLVRLRYVEVQRAAF
jgi:predicted anti-sigma-YlaC factor YlaD